MPKYIATKSQIHGESQTIPCFSVHLCLRGIFKIRLFGAGSILNFEF